VLVISGLGAGAGGSTEMGAAADINHAPFASDIARVKFSFSRVRLTFFANHDLYPATLLHAMDHISGPCGLAETCLSNEFGCRKLMVVRDKAAFRHRHVDTVNLLTIRCTWLCLLGKIEALPEGNCV
jgi:hypothetical protein